MCQGLIGLRLGLALFCLTFTTYGQKAWEKKSYQQWSLSDVVQVLDDSPWAQTQVDHDRISPESARTAFQVTVRLRSALPIRQALVRRRQLYVQYDKLTADDQARFDSEVKGFLECPDCAKYYMVTLDSARGTGPGGGSFFDPLETLKKLSLDELKSTIYLVNDRGERRYLEQFVVLKSEGSGVLFVFPRLDNQGNPFLTSNNKSFYFKVDNKLFEKQQITIKRFTFEVSKLIRNSEVVF